MAKQENQNAEQSREDTFKGNPVSPATVPGPQNSGEKTPDLKQHSMK